jgi:hypothetical protein
MINFLLMYLLFILIKTIFLIDIIVFVENKNIL